MTNSLDRKALTILKKARKLITLKSRWTEGVSAETKAGTPTPVTSSNAYRFCASGALRRYTNRLPDGSELYKNAVSSLSEFLPFGFTSIIGLNDTKGHAAVLKCFDKTIKHLEKQVKKS